jgi:hypothetical protein
MAGVRKIKAREGPKNICQHKPWESIPGKKNPSMSRKLY